MGLPSRSQQAAASLPWLWNGSPCFTVHSRGTSQCLLNTNCMLSSPCHTTLGATYLGLVQVLSQSCALRGPWGQVPCHLPEVSLTPPTATSQAYYRT